MSLICDELGTDIDVQGYRLLLKAITPPEKTKGGIIIPETQRSARQRGYNVGRVLKMGHQAFQPLEKFGGKPFCTLGDWVFYSAYEREEAVINNHLCFFVTDERIYAVIPDLNAVIQEKHHD
jgi:co-chaperonin GroES (HSP10)